MIVFLGIYRYCCTESFFLPGDFILFTDSCQEGGARPFSPDVPDLPRYDVRNGGRALPFQENTRIHSGLECLLGSGGILLPRDAQQPRHILGAILLPSFHHGPDGDLLLFYVIYMKDGDIPPRRPLRLIIYMFADIPLPEHQHLAQWAPRTNLPDHEGKQNLYRNISGFLMQI